MQDVENDIDDIFRRAASNYKVKPGKNNWDKIEPMLTDGEPIASASTNGIKKYKKLLLPVCMLLIATAIFIDYKPNKIELKGKPETFEKNELQKNAGITIQQPVSQKKLINKISIQNLNNKPLIIKNCYVLNKIHPKELYNTLPVKKASAEIDIREKTINQNSFEINKAIIEDEIFSNDLTENQEEKSSTLPTQESPLASNTIINAHAKKQKAVYLGIVAGPAFNEVKHQGLGKTGFDAGITAGYKINAGLSVETGLLFAKKNYFSDGKYFNMQKMPVGMTVLNLEGSSSVFEIPVKMKYNAVQKKKGDIFLSAGISSYILTNEKNNYHAIINGTKQNMQNTYKTSSGYFGAAVNLSTGYEYKIGGRSRLSIEPYIQIPLKGIGVGAMPVSSGGIHIGLTRSVH